MLFYSQCTETDNKRRVFGTPSKIYDRAFCEKSEWSNYVRKNDLS